MSRQKDIDILRKLADRYIEICRNERQEELRDLWRQHNSLKKTRPLVLVRGGKAFAHEIPELQELDCENQVFRGIEKQLRTNLFCASLNDDRIFDPWIVVKAVHNCAGWGISGARESAGDDLTSWKVDYPLKKPEDLEKLRFPWHEINEEETQQQHEEVMAAVGDIIDVAVDRAPPYRSFAGDISTSLHYLRGIENFMMDMMDNPEWLHRLAAFLRDGILATHEQAEEAGDWTLIDHTNQAVEYAQELSDPSPDPTPVRRQDLWYFAAAQEFAGVGPQMHDEFLLQYQLPIISKFGLVAYGCCEDLTNKIDMLRQIPNLRRIAVTPWADVRKCAEQIGTDYVISWRPSPTDMVCAEFKPQRIRSITQEALEACRGLHVDITLKDIQTVRNEPERLKEWVSITKDVAQSF
ncbi:MAG: hypothetical protein ACOCZS_04765 [Verrucomicrobiota bacterium]